MSEIQNLPEGMPELDGARTTADSMDRREAIKTLAAGAALLPVLGAAAQHAHHATTNSVAAAYTPQLIKGTQRDLLTAVCERIIPRTDTPGASDAGVADEIDFMATRRRGLAEGVTSALRRVEQAAGSPFASLTAGEQDRILRKMSEDGSSEDAKAFRLLKDLTIDGYYRTKAGLTQELGWNANTYLPEFKGCTHDHLAVASLGDAAPTGDGRHEVAE